MSAFQIITAQIHTLQQKNRDSERTNIQATRDTNIEITAMLQAAEEKNRKRLEEKGK